MTYIIDIVAGTAEEAVHEQYRDEFEDALYELMGAIMGRIRCAQTPVIQTPVYNGVLRVVPPTYHSVSTAYSIAKIENEPKPTAIQKLSCIASNYVGQ